MKTLPGYTLIELLIATTIGLLISAVTVGIFLNQQLTFNAIDLARAGQDASRDAMTELEPALRRLGFGIDPRYALDFNSYACTTPPCRDSVSGPDNIVFVARNPFYQWLDNGMPGCALVGGCFNGNAWPISSATATSITVTAQPGDQFVLGQVVEAVCPGGSLATMATVGSTTSPVSTPSLVTISLAPGVAGNPYKENNLTSSCFATGGGLFLVDRFHYEIMAFNGTPYLMLDTGLDVNGNGTTPDQGDLNDLIPVAKGVEDMQIAYLLNVPGIGVTPPAGGVFTAPDSNQDWVIGNQAGVGEEPNPGATAPIYSTASNDPLRFNMSPANVRGVRITLSVRSNQPDLSQPTNWLGDPLQLSENRNVQLTDLGRYRRYVTATSISFRNMEAHSISIF